jgi:hypothetical protein
LKELIAPTANQMGDDETHVEYAAIEVGAQHQIYGTYVVIDTDLVLASSGQNHRIALGLQCANNRTHAAQQTASYSITPSARC